MLRLILRLEVLWLLVSLLLAFLVLSGFGIQ
jgi:hypothetical protein